MIYIILNILITILEILSFLLIDDKPITEIFCHYTYCANFLALICGVMMSAIFIKNYKKDNIHIPRYAGILQYVSTVSLAITLIIVFAVLIPLYGEGGLEYYLLNRLRSWLVHLINPILTIITFLLSKKYYKLNKKDIFIPLVVTFLYGIIMMFLNAINAFDGPYQFLKVNKQPIYMSILWSVLILGVVYGISYIFYKCNHGRTPIIKNEE